jgi:NRAMP (natural resistance-associated macrophage protein)-like metal ion transporter
MAVPTDDQPKLANTPTTIAPAEETSTSNVAQKVRTVFIALGPGLVTGASDDDPSGIATYSQIGAQFGYGMLWTMVLTYPLMAAIQEVSARIGRVTGAGISANLRRCYPRWLLFSVIGLLLIGNIFNLGADIGAMGAAAQLLLPTKDWLYVIVFGLLSLLLQIFVPYTSYVKYLKWLTLSLFAYIATAFFVKISWGEVVQSTLLPRLSWDKEYLTGLIAALGTTISPYLFFWQASQEVEDLKSTRGDKPLKRAKRQAPVQLGRIRIDTYFGMALSNIVAFFIILTTAATLHAHGQKDVGTAAQAAQALAPLAGKWASTIFVCGIIGTGLLAIPVLAGSAAYAVGEGLNWNASLEQKPEEAAGFYGVIAVATVIGIALNFIGINPMKALFWAAVLNGVLAAPLMAVIMHMASSKKVMDKFIVPHYLRVVGWMATAAMLVVAIGVIATWK